MTKFRFDGQLIHFNAVRMRVTGVGNLNINMSSLDDVYSANLAPLALVAANNREPTQLVNFVQQRAKVKIGTNQINEWFNVSQIIVYVRTIATSFPQ